MTDVPIPPEPARPAVRVRLSRDLVAGLALVALAVFALWASAPLEVGTLRAVGPGAMPRGTALLILGGGVVLSAAALVKGGAPLGRWRLRGAFFVCLSIAAFSLTIRSVGLAVAGPVVVLISGAASEETRPVELLVFAVVMTAFCVGLFRYALGLPIPILYLPGLVTI